METSNYSVVFFWWVDWFGVVPTDYSCSRSQVDTTSSSDGLNEPDKGSYHQALWLTQPPSVHGAMTNPRKIDRTGLSGLCRSISNHAAVDAADKILLWRSL